MFAVLDVLLMFTDHSYLNSVYVISYNYSWQCVWAHIHGLYAYDHLEPRYQSERQKARALTGSILVFIIDLDPGWIENKSQLTGWTNFFKILKDNA